MQTFINSSGGKEREKILATFIFGQTWNASTPYRWYVEMECVSWC